MQENRPAAQIAAKRSDGAIYVTNRFGVGGNRSQGLSPGRRASSPQHQGCATASLIQSQSTSTGRYPSN